VGAGGNKNHEAYAVSPADAAAAAPGVGAVAEGEAIVPESASAFSDAVGALPLAPAADGTDPSPSYAELSAATEEALGLHQQALDEGWSPQLAAEGLKALKQQTSAHLSSLSPEQLQGLAAEQGFEHPTLVGLTEEPGAQHPLVHWLDPVYPTSSPSKLKIQAKAAERYAQLAAGESVSGLTLADVQAAEAGFVAPPPPGAWEATPADVVGAMAGLNQALADLDWSAVKHGSSDGGLAALVAAENHLAAAQCPEMGAQLDAAKGSAKAAVDKALLAPSYMRNLAIDQLAAAAHQEGTLSFAEAKLLTRDEQLALLRASTSHLERQGIAKDAAARAAEFDKLKELYAAHKAAAATLPQLSLGSADAQQHLVSGAKTSGAYFAQRQQVASWASGLAGTQELQADAGPLHGLTSYDAASITSTFRNWAKGQKLADLKAAAQDLGMETAGASRAQVQNYIAASWDAKYDQGSIAAAVGSGKGGAAGPAAPKPVPKSVSPSSAPLSAGAVLGGGSPRSFATKHLQVVAALKAHQAITADLPPRPGQSDVDGWSFGPGKAATLGGAHAKSVHAAPDGSLWLFKPDKTNHGARAHAEAAASEILHRVGVPSVGVYVKKVGGQLGSIQPLVSGATSLPSDPNSWSQAEVDAVVRYHVAAWAVGDHDGNHTNILRTPSGGLLPVDQGQAFKFYGSDRLDASYHPNGSYGAAPPVFHQAYQAGKSGLLANGVAIRPEAALPVIRAFERIPDAQYRAILAPVAAEGVKRKVAWVGPIKKGAQKRLGKTAVSDGDVAEEFLRQAVERKNGLRKAFATFFSGLGYSSGAKLEKVA
jgi:hypothetical protein